VIANGVGIKSGAMIELIGHTMGTLTQGMVLTLISNTSADPISGTFSNLPDGSIVTIKSNTFLVSYSGGAATISRSRCALNKRRSLHCTKLQG